MDEFTLKQLARLGAERRLDQLRTEERALYEMFPDLATRAASVPVERPRKKRKRMTPAQRAEVSARMKRAWARKRAAQKNAM